MVLTTGTIHEVLARRNPTLDVKTKNGKNTKDPSYEKVERSSLRPWRDFDYQHLINGWGHLLAVGGVQGRMETSLSNSQKEINDEDKIDSIAEAWNVECLRDPLKKGATVLRGSSQPDITIRKRYMQYPRNHKRPLEPDMAIFLRDGDRLTSTTLVMGDHKCATKWTHEKMFNSKTVDEGMWPVRQLTTYCKLGKTRYGYIMSTSEVVVFRVSKNPSSSGAVDSPFILEWNYVPWTNSGEGRLTVNLAIWWLGMMGLVDRHREIVLPPRLMPINIWLKETNKKDKTNRFTHLLSRRKVANLPSGERYFMAS